ncbi:hypothetical protein EXIGLDRAFT_84902 [Exidia glandulosa HHB12029]|uniref:Uncharacterized protein n=1 Tax=Exidia glandulosa HHB12029 TaxID=1314781 RepID=A0A165HIS4_EXIGL|nr:hypothetical protein EXIGLDRAFT_84902 [Exidia glandulosa HHB12029]
MIMFKVIDHYAFYLMKSRCSRHPTLRAPSLASSAAMMAFLVLVAAFTFVTYPTIRHLSDNRIRATRCHRSRFHDGVRLAANANPVVVAACSPAAPASVAACLVARQRCNLIRLACLAETPSLCYHPVHDLHGDLLRIFPSIPALALLLRMQL